MSRRATLPRVGHSIVLAALVLLSLSALAAWAGKAPRADLGRRATAAHARGLEFLAATQRADGELPTYHWFTDRPPKLDYVATPFTVSQVLYSLRFGPRTPAGRRVAERGVAYLLAQREPPGVWRYYGKAGAHLLSPDVDDTALAWAALLPHGHRPEPAALDALRASRTPAGLFTTWIGDRSTWIGVDSTEPDLVVNLNALLLFAMVGQPVDEVCRQAVAHVKDGTFTRGSIYYPSPLAYSYAITRAWADAGAACLGEAIPAVRASALAGQRADGGWGDDLDSALGAITLLNSGYRAEALERAVAALLARQDADGGWKLAAAYRGAQLPVNYGSRAITTALALEALAKYLTR